MKIEFCGEGWRIREDGTDYPEPPREIIPHDLLIQGPVELRLDLKSPSKRGWLFVPDETKLEVLN